MKNDSNKTWLFSFFCRLNILSLDVVFIALVWQEVFARTAHVVLKWEERSVLAVSIWIVYILDHWLDTKAPSQNLAATDISFSNKAPRHHYVRNYARAFRVLIILAFSTNICLLPFLSWRLLVGGAVLAFATLVYLLLNYFFLCRHWWLKGREIIISLIFSFGCALAAAARSYRPGLLLPWIIIFAIVAFINCTLIARMERKVSLLELAPPCTFSRQWIFLFFLVALLLSFSSSIIIKALCWSLIGLSTTPLLARRFGYEGASLAADQALFFGALLSLIR